MTLKAFRQTAGLSIKGLSDKTGISVSSLWNYEKQNALPNKEIAKKLAAVYGLEFSELEPLVKNAQGITQAEFKEHAEDFKAKFKDVPAETKQKKAEDSKPTEEPITRKVNARPEETRKIPEIVHDKNEIPIPWQIKTATDADYIEAVNAAVKALRAILGADNNGMIMLAVGFVTAEIESKLFIDR